MRLTPSDPSDALKSFSLTHILYDPSHRLSIPLALLSLSPIFLFVAYFTLLIFTRRLTILALGLGQVGNEVVSLALKRIFLEDRPYRGVLREVGEGYGMPSSHSQAAGFLVAWGVGYALTQAKRRAAEGKGMKVSTEKEVDSPGKSGKKKEVKKSNSGMRFFGKSGKVEVQPVDTGIVKRPTGAQTRRAVVKKVVTGIYIFGLVLWSLAVAYSRWYLRYHSRSQIVAGYIAGLTTGSAYFFVSEYVPLYFPFSVLGRFRRAVEGLWEGVGGVGGWSLGAADGGWGEGWVFVDEGKGE